MGIRETLNKNPMITTGATIAIIILAILVIVWEILPARPPRAPTKSFYTDDDGASYFPDDINRVPPFDHNGKDAVRCYVFSCPGKGKFVGYLEKYTKDMASKILAAKASSNMDALDQLDTDSGREVKKPGDAKWIRVATHDAEAENITNVKCPDNPSALITPEYPP